MASVTETNVTLADHILTDFRVNNKYSKAVIKTYILNHYRIFLLTNQLKFEGS